MLDESKVISPYYISSALAAAMTHMVILLKQNGPYQQDKSETIEGSIGTMKLKGTFSAYITKSRSLYIIIMSTYWPGTQG